jgi:hypothetical protein
MVNKVLSSSLNLTNKAFWHYEVVTNNKDVVSATDVNQNADLISNIGFKPVLYNLGLLNSKQYPFKNAARKAKGSLQSFSRPPKA